MVATAKLENIAPPNIIYRADIDFRENKEHKFYFGVAQTLFKEIFRNYNRDFNH